MTDTFRAPTASQKMSPSWSAFLALGFRPFYLLGAIYATLSVVLWTASWLGHIVVTPVLSGSLWHAHELIFGFVAAIIVGFLFTAVQVWTKRPTPKGWLLGVIALVWIIARIAIFTGNLPLTLASNLTFLLSSTMAITIPIVAARNWRNLYAPLLLLFLTGAETSLLLSTSQPALTLFQGQFLSITASILMLLIAVIGGRVIPFFTRNALPNINLIVNPTLDCTSIGLLILILLTDIAGLFLPQHFLLNLSLLLLAAIAHLLRLILWQPFATRRSPILWVLMVSYAWLPVSLLLLVGAEFGLIDPLLPLHGIFTGLVSGMIIGMITRTARGHTGRPLTAKTPEKLMYALVHVAAIARVILPIFWPLHMPAFIVGSTMLWALAFLTYAVTYAPKLIRARPDGQPG